MAETLSDSHLDWWETIARAAIPGPYGASPYSAIFAFGIPFEHPWNEPEEADPTEPPYCQIARVCNAPFGHQGGDDLFSQQARDNKLFIEEALNAFVPLIAEVKRLRERDRLR